ncbi:MAG: hypothetical protein WCK58_18405, partial [Chloroflexota bacterium]
MRLFNAIRTRLLPAIVTALGVVLVTAGLLSYADPTQAGTIPDASIDVSDSPSPGVEPSPSDGASPSVGPTASTTPTAKPSGRALATRVVIPALKIDLPVVKGPDGYPLCNVAMYMHTGDTAAADAFGQPGEGRATYLYAHARDGMFGPIYELAIVAGQGRKMLGMIVQVYTSDNRLYLYEITEVLLHQLNFDRPLGAQSEELWLQTSEGPKGTPGKT